MVIQKIHLRHFRNFPQFSCEFSPNLTILLAPNASGKTNLLEAIYFLLAGRGFRESRELELLNFDDPQHASVEGAFLHDETSDKYLISVALIGEAVAKSFFTNKTKVRQNQYLKELTRAVLFAPQQIEMLTGSPDLRRSYINTILSSYDPEYKKRLANYESAIRRRNKILEKVFDPVQLRQELSFWNTYLIEQAEYITSSRQSYIDFLNSNAVLEKREFEAVYVKNEFTLERIHDKEDLEQKVRKTLIGPQKDDIEVYMKHDGKRKNMKHFGSRSEQRLSMLWLKINEIIYCEKKLGMRPILLLDDVFSEFDEVNKKLVLKLVRKYQTVATTTEKEIAEFAPVEFTVVPVKA
jgi:DNA replication and repair protein RecF